MAASSRISCHTEGYPAKQNNPVIERQILSGLVSIPSFKKKLKVNLKDVEAEIEDRGAVTRELEEGEWGELQYEDEAVQSFSLAEGALSESWSKTGDQVN